MINWLYKHFPPDKNYLVRQTDNGQINSSLNRCLVELFQSGPKHNIWGKNSEFLSEIGKNIGWVPDKIPATFLSDTAEEEIADVFAQKDGFFKPESKHFMQADEILSQFKIEALAKRNPFFLSEGETKILWLVTQVAKQPKYLIIGNLPLNLSPNRTQIILDYLMNTLLNDELSPIIILGYQQQHLEWCDSILKNDAWEKKQIWPEINDKIFKN